MVRGVLAVASATLVVGVAAGCGPGAANGHPTVSPTPRPIPGQVVFTDNFDNASSGWLNDLSQRSAYVRGGYTFAGNPDETEYTASPYWSPLVQGVTIAVDATQSRGDPGVTYFGIGCGNRHDHDPEFEFLLSADGEYVIERAGSPPSDVLAAGTAAVHPVGTPNHLEATCTRGAFPDGSRGMQLGLSVNGQTVASAVDAHFGASTAWTGGLLTSSWTASSVGVVFRHFTVTDVAPTTLPAQSLPRVVYENTLRDPFTGWLNTNSYDAFQGQFVDGHWQLQALTGASSWVPSPYAGQDVVGVTVSASAKYVSGGSYASAGVACFDASSGKGIYAFTLDSHGGWSISADDGGKYLHTLASGHTSERGPQISGTCVWGPGATNRLVMRVGSVQVGSATSSSAHPAAWNGGVSVITTAGDPSATFTFGDFSLTRIA